MDIRTSRRDLMLSSGAFAAASLLPFGAEAATAASGWARAARIVAQVRPPVFPPRSFSIIDYGAKGDGTTKNTAAIARAIEACHQAGGGRVLVPSGSFLTGAVHLKSNVELHLVRGATLLFSTDTADYPVVFTRWEGVELMGYSPLIYAYKQKNIAITGEGTLDGQASDRFWWSWKGPNWRGSVEHGWREGMPHQVPARTALFQAAENNVPVEKRVYADGAYLRPPLIQPYLCENVLIEGIKLRRSPFWHVHPVLCTNVLVRKVDFGSLGPNTDGCNPESSRMMVIEDCLFDTGDDCIAVDSGRNADGRRIGVPAEDIVIRRCEMKEGHGAIVIGSVISGGVRNVFAEDCRIGSPHLTSALRFKNNAMRGGLLENFYYRNITISQVEQAAILCDFNYEEGANGPYAPVLRNVWFDNIRAAQTTRVLDLQGLPVSPIRNINLRNCSFDGVTAESIVKHTADLRLDAVRVNGKIVQRL